MSVLDELREQVKRRARLNRAIDDLFDTFEAEHPGLVDYTSRCLLCRKPINPATSPGVNNPITGEYIGDICPACAKDAPRELAPEHSQAPRSQDVRTLPQSGEGLDGGRWPPRCQAGRG